MLGVLFDGGGHLFHAGSGLFETGRLLFGALGQVIGACGDFGMPIRCGLEPVGDVFYDLELSSRAAPALLELDVAAFSRYYYGPDAFAALFNGAESGCGEFAMCGSSFSSRLAPGRYRIAVSQTADSKTGTPIPLAVRVRLRDADCTATTNDTWQTAIELDPNAERQRLRSAQSPRAPWQGAPGW